MLASVVGDFAAISGGATVSDAVDAFGSGAELAEALTRLPGELFATFADSVPSAFAGFVDAYSSITSRVGFLVSETAYSLTPFTSITTRTTPALFCATRTLVSSLPFT